VISGIDISSAQGVLTDDHWAKIAQNQRFVYVEAQIGNDTLPIQVELARRNVALARAAGLVVGAYHFAYPLPDLAGRPNRDPEGQCQLFFEAANGLGGQVGELPPALDLEWPAYGDWEKWSCSAEQITEWALRFLVRAETLFGRRPIVYTYPAFAKVAGLQGLNSYGLWIASYQPVPHVPEPWTSCVMQQTKGGDGLRLPNGSPCDTDVSTEESFAALLT
jgi:lysozyme